MQEELFGPVVTAFVYDDAARTRRSTLVDPASPYGLTGAVFARDRAAIVQAARALRYAAGNFYVNDKPTGAVVGQQPFGGARASGTNDKAGSMWNLIRWVSPRAIKETFAPPPDYRYPFLSGEQSAAGGTALDACVRLAASHRADGETAFDGAQSAEACAACDERRWSGRAAARSRAAAGGRAASRRLHPARASPGSPASPPSATRKKASGLATIPYSSPPWKAT